MKPLKFIFALVVTFALPASLVAQEGRDKVGTVDMQKLLTEYYKTAALLKEYEGYRTEILDQNKERVERIKALSEETRNLQETAESSSLTPEKQEQLLNELVLKQREVQALQNDRITWLRRKQAAFAEKEKIDLGKLREEIMGMVQEEGKAREFDFIFDKSAASAANVLVLAYAKDAADLTAVMIERINEDAPSETEEDVEGEEASSE